MYFVLFKTSDDTIDSTGTLGSHWSYIVEKFDLFFTSPPDQENLHMNLHWGNQEVWNRGTEYMVHWNADLNEFLNIEEYPKWLFTHYIRHSTKEYEEMREKYKEDKWSRKITISDEEFRIRILIQMYNKFFTSYDFISEENLEYVLHAKLKDFYYRVIEQHKMIFRNVYVNQLTK
jgi:hypothetical protein